MHANTYHIFQKLEPQNNIVTSVPQNRARGHKKDDQHSMCEIWLEATLFSYTILSLLEQGKVNIDAPDELCIHAC